MTNFMNYKFNITDIELACKVEPGEGQMIHRNRRNYGLAIFLDGERTFSFDNKKLKVGKNTIVYFPKGSNYTIKEIISPQQSCYAINFQMGDVATFEPFAFKIKNANLYLDNFKSALKIWDKKSFGYDAKVKSEIYDIIYNIQSEYNMPYVNSSIIQPAIDYIHTNYYKECISIAELAKMCNISSVYLCNCFTKRFSMSPTRYINTLKLNRAEEMLASNLYSIKNVCFLCGFNDLSYFSRIFKKKFGKSPRDYQKASH